MVRHLVIVSYFAWGHLRPECALAVNLARKFTDVVISFLVDADFTARARDEMARQCDPAEAHALLARIRLLSAGRTHAGLSPALLASLMLADPRDLHTPAPHATEAATRVLHLLLADEHVTDDVGAHFPPAGAAPRALIGDVMMGAVLTPAKQQHPHLWLLLWWVGSASAFSRMYAPHARGGKADGYVQECEDTFADEHARNGRSFGDIARDTWSVSRRVPDNTLRLAGLPPFYQHEDAPQAFWFPTLFDALRKGAELTKLADGFLLPTVDALEPAQLRDIVDWARPRRVLCCGPQLPRELLAGAGARTREVNYNQGDPFARVVAGAGMQSAEDHVRAASAVEQTLPGPDTSEPTLGEAVPGAKVPGTDPDPTLAFLDQALAEHGAHSALYISFGSVFFPQPSHLALLLHVLLALPKPMPFVLTLSRGTLPEELDRQIERSGRGLVVTWAPQQTLLAHPALGWMLTHCGGGGTFESLALGVPVIAWPFSGDQPQHALWISEVLRSGFELLQVRTGAGAAGPAYRGRGAAAEGTADADGAGEAEAGAERGTQIVGTEAAIREEMERVLGMCQGEEGERRRGNARQAREKILAAVKLGGSADRAMDQLEWIF